MGAHTSMLHVRIDDNLKAEATKALEAMGLSASDAVRMLFRRIVAEQAFPLELKVPNDETLAAMEESHLKFEQRRTRFKAADEMLAALEKDV